MYGNHGVSGGVLPVIIITLAAGLCCRAQTRSATERILAGDAALEQHDWSAASTAYQEALQLQPTHPDANVMRAITLLGDLFQTPTQPLQQLLDDWEASYLPDVYATPQQWQGLRPEPFIDANANGQWDRDEVFTDLDRNGDYSDHTIPETAPAANETVDILNAAFIERLDQAIERLQTARNNAPPEWSRSLTPPMFPDYLEESERENWLSIDPLDLDVALAFLQAGKGLLQYLGNYDFTLDYACLNGTENGLLKALHTHRSTLFYPRSGADFNPSRNSLRSALGHAAQAVSGLLARPEDAGTPGILVTRGYSRDTIGEMLAFVTDARMSLDAPHTWAASAYSLLGNDLSVDLSRLFETPPTKADLLPYNHESPEASWLLSDPTIKGVFPQETRASWYRRGAIRHNLHLGPADPAWPEHPDALDIAALEAAGSLVRSITLFINAYDLTLDWNSLSEASDIAYHITREYWDNSAEFMMLRHPENLAEALIAARSAVDWAHQAVTHYEAGGSGSTTAGYILRHWDILDPHDVSRAKRILEDVHLALNSAHLVQAVRHDWLQQDIEVDLSRLFTDPIQRTDLALYDPRNLELSLMLTDPTVKGLFPSETAATWYRRYASRRTDSAFVAPAMDSVDEHAFDALVAAIRGLVLFQQGYDFLPTDWTRRDTDATGNIPNVFMPLGGKEGGSLAISHILTGAISLWSPEEWANNPDFFTIRDPQRFPAAKQSIASALDAADMAVSGILSGQADGGVLATRGIDTDTWENIKTYIDDVRNALTQTTDVRIEERDPITANLARLFDAPLTRTDLPQERRDAGDGSTEFDWGTLPDPSLHHTFPGFSDNADVMAAYTHYLEDLNLEPDFPGGLLPPIVGVTISGPEQADIAWSFHDRQRDTFQWGVLNRRQWFPVIPGEDYSLVFDYIAEPPAVYLVEYADGSVIRAGEATVVGEISFTVDRAVTALPAVTLTTATAGARAPWATVLENLHFGDFLERIDVFSAAATAGRGDPPEKVDSIPASGIDPLLPARWESTQPAGAPEIAFHVQTVFRSPFDNGQGESRSPTLTLVRDSDGDSMPDWWEMAHGLDVNNPADSDIDDDNDGLPNRDEFRHRTNPAATDSDGDGASDGKEVEADSDPNDPDSRPLAIRTHTLPQGQSWQAYSAILQADGGTEPYGWDAPAVRDYAEFAAGNSFQATGTPMGWQAAPTSWELHLPFAFPFYGQTYTTCWVDWRGRVSFDGPGSSVDDYDVFLNTPMIAALWAENLHFSLGSDVFVSSANGDQGAEITIRWFGLYSDDTPWGISVSVTLAADGSIRLRYGDTEQDGMIGISAGDGSRFLQTTWSWRQMQQAKDIVFRPVTPWPRGVALSAGGQVSGIPEVGGQFDLYVRVRDIQGRQAASLLRLDLTVLDDDQDGIPDPWEYLTFKNTSDSNGNGDYDGDGESDAEEWRSGSDPTDACDTTDPARTYRDFSFALVRTVRQVGTLAEPASSRLAGPPSVSRSGGLLERPMYGVSLTCNAPPGWGLTQVTLTTPDNATRPLTILNGQAGQWHEPLLGKNLEDLQETLPVGIYRVDMSLEDTVSRQSGHLRFKIALAPYTERLFPPFVAFLYPGFGERHVPTLPQIVLEHAAWDQLLLRDHGTQQILFTISNYRDQNVADLPGPLPEHTVLELLSTARSEWHPWLMSVVVSQCATGDALVVRQGWNLVSGALGTAGRSLDQTQSMLFGNYAIGRIWEAVPPAGRYRPLPQEPQCEPTAGYWGFAERLDLVNAAARTASSRDTVTLRQGWNLVALPTADGLLTVGDILASLDTPAVWSWDAEQRCYRPLGSDSVLDRRLAYWVYSPERDPVMIGRSAD